MEALGDVFILPALVQDARDVPGAASPLASGGAPFTWAGTAWQRVAADAAATGSILQAAAGQTAAASGDGVGGERVVPPQARVVRQQRRGREEETGAQQQQDMPPPPRSLLRRPGRHLRAPRGCDTAFKFDAAFRTAYQLAERALRGSVARQVLAYAES